MLPTTQFLDYLRYERNYSDHTVTAYAEDLRQFEAFGNEMWKDIEPQQVDADLIRECVEKTCAKVNAYLRLFLKCVEKTSAKVNATFDFFLRTNVH